MVLYNLDSALGYSLPYLSLLIFVVFRGMVEFSSEESSSSEAHLFLREETSEPGPILLVFS